MVLLPDVFIHLNITRLLAPAPDSNLYNSVLALSSHEIPRPGDTRLTHCAPIALLSREPLSTSPHTPHSEARSWSALISTHFETLAVFRLPLESFQPSPKSPGKGRPWLEEAGATMGANSFRLSSCSQILKTPQVGRTEAW